MNILCATAISAICSHHKPMHQRANAAVVHDSSLHIVGIMKKYGCDGAKQLEEYLITWGINNFFTLLLFFSVSFWCVALRLVWSQTSVKDIGSCGHEDIFIVCELQLYRSGQNCHKILSRPFTSKGESERDRERERAIERLYLETTNNAVLSCICNKSVVP